MVLNIISFQVPKIRCSRTVSDSILLFRSSVATTRAYSQKASVTVTLFTVLFLICNTPYFVNMVLALAGLIYPQLTKSLSKSHFMSYSWTVSKVHFTVLNATLNPLFYLSRMRAFRRWIRNGSVAVWLASRTFPLSPGSVRPGDCSLPGVCLTNGVKRVSPSQFEMKEVETACNVVWNENCLVDENSVGNGFVGNGNLSETAGEPEINTQIVEPGIPCDI